MIANEIEIMRDELRNRLAAAADRPGPVPRPGQAVARRSWRPSSASPPPRRVKTLLVLSAIAEQEGIDATAEQIEAEIAEQLARYGDDAAAARVPRLAARPSATCG